MEKLTLKFDCLINMAMFSKGLSAGYLMNTNNFTLTDKLSEQEVQMELSKYEAILVEYSDKIYSYENLLSGFEGLETLPITIPIEKKAVSKEAAFFRCEYALEQIPESKTEICSRPLVLIIIVLVFFVHRYIIENRCEANIGRYYKIVTDATPDIGD